MFVVVPFVLLIITSVYGEVTLSALVLRGTCDFCSGTAAVVSKLAGEDLLHPEWLRRCWLSLTIIL